MLTQPQSMVRRTITGVLLVGLSFVWSTRVQAQEPINLSVHGTELSQIFTQLYGPEGLVVKSHTPPHTGGRPPGHQHRTPHAPRSHYMIAQVRTAGAP